MNLPNRLTLSRIFMIPLFVAFFYLQFKAHYFVALAIFGIASFTDFLDGRIARKHNLVTNFGKFLDPIADKVLVLSAFVIFLTVPQFYTRNLGDWALIVAGCGIVLVLAREIIVSGFRLVASTSGIVIAADIFGKYKTVSQDFAIVFLLAAESFYEFFDNTFCLVISYIGLGFFVISLVLTVISGANYICKNFEVLKK